MSTSPAALPGEIGALPDVAAHKVWLPLLRALIPIVLALVAGAIVLLALGRDPLAFYREIVSAGLLKPGGLQDTLTRMAPLLLMACGFIVAFWAGLWNIGGDGQFLIAAAVVGGLGPLLADAVPSPVMWIVLCLAGAAAGAVWTLLPAFLKAWYGTNEVITTLMMSFVGVNLANLLIKENFRSSATTVPQTDVVPFQQLLPYIPGTTVHVGLIVAFVLTFVVWYATKRTAFGLRLQILGTSPRAALHAGLPVKWLILVAFAASGGLIGLAAAVEVQGVWGYVRADWNPAWGTTLFALVFLAGLDALAVIPLVAFFALLTIGGEAATLAADLPNDFLLVFVGLVLVFLTLTTVVERLLVRRRRRALPGERAAVTRSSEGDHDSVPGAS
jgi:general nucleoside transport system permease protein